MHAGRTAGAEPRQAFRAALRRYKGARLAAIRLAQGAAPNGSRIRPVGNADEITEHLDQPATVAGSGRQTAARRTASPSASSASPRRRRFRWRGSPTRSRFWESNRTRRLSPLLELGLLAIELGAELGSVDEFRSVLEHGNPMRVRLRIHPAVPRGIRTARPEAKLPKAAGPVSQVRESDGLEPILRLGALWQRIGAEPLRQTNQGTLYKRDRDRLAEDPVLAGPIADALETLARLARAVAGPGPPRRTDRARPRRRAARRRPTRFLDRQRRAPSPDDRDRLDGAASLGRAGRDGLRAKPVGHALTYLRAAVLLWLTALDDSGVGSPRRPGGAPLRLVARLGPGCRLRTSRAPRSSRRRRGAPRGRARDRIEVERAPRGVGLLESILLGAAYPLGLVRAAEEGRGRRRVVQLTPFGRYVLALGPTPPPRATFEQFLFVQPNFEVIAYRQGLTPQLVGQLSRFAWWSQLGAALELKLTRESIVHGLDGGLTPESMLETLTRHSQRPLPPGVIDAVKNWATRRERVTYYAAATLIEFGSRDRARCGAGILARARSDRPGLRGRPIPAGRGRANRPVRSPAPDRFARLSTSRRGLRDRRGRRRVTGARSGTRGPVGRGRAVAVHRPASHDRTGRRPAYGAGAAAVCHQPGITTAGIEPRRLCAQLTEWFARRTGGEIPPALQLLLMVQASRVPTLKSARRIVLNLPSVVLLDGLLQHPTTSHLLGDRLGPTSVAIPDDHMVPLHKALKELGINLEIE